MTGNLTIGCISYTYKKKYSNFLGQMLRKDYENGKITTESEFKEVLQMCYLVAERCK